MKTPKKGHIFHGPDGQGYRMTRDAIVGDSMKPGYFEPFGGAPDPVGGEYMPQWLSVQLGLTQDGLRT